jgi:hypothetical protein
LQSFSIAWNAPPTLKIAISRPPASTVFPDPVGISSTRATFTKEPISISLSGREASRQETKIAEEPQGGARCQIALFSVPRFVTAFHFLRVATAGPAILRGTRIALRDVGEDCA